VIRDAKAAWLHAASRKIRGLALPLRVGKGSRRGRRKRNSAESRDESDAAFVKRAFGDGFLAPLSGLGSITSS
jgi:hypothetical protein